MIIKQSRDPLYSSVHKEQILTVLDIMGFSKFKRIEKFLRTLISALLIASGVLWLILSYLWSWSQIVCFWQYYYKTNYALEIANFLITAFAFITAGLAFIWQHKSLELQKKLGIKQEIIGAWQVLTNKAPGNSGKREAIEFLVEQGIDLRSINLSKGFHGDKVCLDNLNVNSKNPAKLWEANFEGSGLFKANFIGAKLEEAKFNCADLREANFELATLYRSNFKGADLTSSIFRCTNLTRADFSSCKNTITKLVDADFSGSILNNANFCGAHLYGANFQNTNLADSNFQCTHLMNANFENVSWHFMGLNSHPDFYQELCNRFAGSFILSDNENDLPKSNKEYRFAFDLDDNSQKRFENLNGGKKFFIKIIPNYPPYSPLPQFF